MDSSWMILLGVALILLGFFLILAGTLLSAGNLTGKTEVGGVVLIGPVPVVFGNTEEAALSSVVLAATVLLLFLVWLYFIRTP